MYIKCYKATYGMSEAGDLSNQQLNSFLKPHRYTPCLLTPFLCTQKKLPIAFSLAVGFFWGQICRGKHVDHLHRILLQHYKIIEQYCKGKLFCGLTLEWNYSAGYVETSLLVCVQRALFEFQHGPPNNTQHAPYKWTKPNYGFKVQMTPDADTTDPLDHKQKISYKR